MSNIKACIFDLDGTLTNTINAIAHFGNIALAAFGLPEIPVEDYKIYVGDGRDKLIHRMLGVYGKDNAEMFEKVPQHLIEQGRLAYIRAADNCYKSGTCFHPVVTYAFPKSIILLIVIRFFILWLYLTITTKYKKAAD